MGVSCRRSVRLDTSSFSCPSTDMGEDPLKQQMSEVTNLFNKISMCTSSPPPPRVCHLKKWDDFDGYGFNLHAEKNKPGQFVGKIDADSPAEAAGLKEGDRIVEVNGVNVNMENHKQVVQRIKAVVGETRLLVVDKQCDEWHKEQQVVVRQGLPYTVFLSSEADQEVIDTRLQEVVTPAATTPEVTPVQRQPSLQSSSSLSSSVSPSSSSRTSPSPSDSPDVGLNLNMTAKEMRERLGSQKRRDPRKDSNKNDMRRKFEMIQAL